MVAPPSCDLILSSGFLCFSSHVGALAALEERGLQPDAFVGTSSGSLAAAMLAAGLPVDAIREELSAQRPIRLARPSSRPWRGPVGTRALVRRLRNILPPTFADCHYPLAVGVYDTEEPERIPLLLTEGDLPLAVAASCAVPRIFKPVRIGGRWYADGGAVDRTGVQAWRRWRPGRSAIVELVSDVPFGEYGPRDGFGADDPGLLELRTPRAKASFFSLGAYDAEVERAKAAVRAQLEYVVKGPQWIDVEP
jgi:predicted acylesterase/phospholipase RssA